MGNLVKCGACGREVSSEAAACPGCGHPSEQAQVSKSKNIGLAMLSVPLVGTGLVWFWVGEMTLLQSPMESLGLLVLGVIGVTAATAAVEEGRARHGHPVTWLLGMLAMWIFVFPSYLKHRSDGRKGVYFAGLFAAVVFAVSAYTVADLIETQKASVRAKLKAAQDDMPEWLKKH